MKRLPLFLGILIIILCILVISIIVFLPVCVLWLLGVHKPFKFYGDMCDSFGDIIDPSDV